MTVTHVTEGVGAPTSAPPSKGAHYLDTSTGDQYLAKGTASAADWLRQPRVIIGGAPPTEALVAEAGTYYYDTNDGFHYLAAPYDENMYWERLPAAYEIEWNVDLTSKESVIFAPFQQRAVCNVTTSIKFASFYSLACNMPLTENELEFTFAGSGVFSVQLIGGADAGWVAIIQRLDGVDMSATMDSKVDKVEGMGLSSNDFTDEEKARLASTGGVGDVLVTLRTLTGDYLPADGSVQLQEDYPDLFDLVGIPNPKTIAENWEVDASLAAGANDKFYSVATDKKGTWIVATRAGLIFRSTDNGVAWESIAATVGWPDGTQVWGVVASTSSNNTWMIFGQGGKAFRSTDSGATWAEVTDVFSGYSGAILCGATDSNGKWHLFNNAFMSFRSADNGATWVAIDTGGENVHMVAALGSYWVFGLNSWSAQVAVRTSANFTNTNWVMKPLPEEASSKRAAGYYGGVFVVATNAGLMRSGNGAQTWELAQAGDFKGVAVDIAGNWMAVDSLGALWSSDWQGVSWTKTLDSAVLSGGAEAIAVGQDAAWLLSGAQGTDPALALNDAVLPYDKDSEFQVPFYTPPAGFKAYIKAR